MKGVLTMVLAFIVAGCFSSIALAPRGMSNAARADLALKRKEVMAEVEAIAARRLLERRRGIWAGTDRHLFAPPPVAPDFQEMGW